MSIDNIEALIYTYGSSEILCSIRNNVFAAVSKKTREIPLKKECKNNSIKAGLSLRSIDESKFIPNLMSYPRK